MFIISYIFLWLIVLLLGINAIFVMRKFKPNAAILEMSEHGLPHGSIFPKLNLKSINGDQIDLVQHQKSGTILVVLSLHCSSCANVYPDLTNFSNKYPHIQVMVLIYGDEKSVKEKIDKLNLNLPVVLLSDDDLEDFRISLYPFSYFLSPNGNVLAKGGIPAGMSHLELLTHVALKQSKKQVS